MVDQRAKQERRNCQKPILDHEHNEAPHADVHRVPDSLIQTYSNRIFYLTHHLLLQKFFYHLCKIFT